MTEDPDVTAPRAPTAALPLAAAVLLLPGAAAGSLAVEPTPVPADGTATLRATFEDDVTEADAVACLADADETVRSCFRPVEMTQDEDGSRWTATLPPQGRFGEAPLVGFNATGATADGTRVHLPDDGSRYRFVAVAATDAAAPASGLAGALAAGLAGAALRRTRD